MISIRLIIPIVVKYQSLQCIEKYFALTSIFSFFKPKIDQCAAFDRYKTASIENKLQIEQNHYQHLRRMHHFFIAKDIDSILSKITSGYAVYHF